MSFAHDLYVYNNLDVNVNTTILGSLAVGQSTAAENSAAFEVDSTTKGLLFPRMTTAQKDDITSPADGLMVYDTDEGALFYYSGASSDWTMVVKNAVDNTNVLIGNKFTGDSLSTGQFNIILGRDSGQNIATTICNTVVGDFAGIALTGNRNIIMGANAVEFATTADDCTIIGEDAGEGLTTGDKNIMLGGTAGATLATGANCLLLGYGTDAAAGLNNQIAIGYSAVADKANQAMIGDATLIEMVPNSGASANLGTLTNPWNDLHIKGNTSILGSVAIGQSGSAEASSILELESTTKGFLLPRMTTTQRNAITTPAAGLMVYDTTKDSIYHYNGTSWTIMVRNTVNDSNIIIGNNTSGDSLSSGTGNIILGRDNADNYNSTNSVFIGENVLEIATDSADSVIVGANSGNLMTTGSIKNTSCGEGTFAALTTGARNTALGNIAGGTLTTGLNNTMIGANTVGAATLSNQIALGYQATSFKDNQVMVGNSSVIEMVPHASASANLGTSTNPWNNSRLKGNMSVGSSTDPVASSLLEMTSTSQGLLIPRMTTAQRDAIVSPVDGLMVYDTDRNSLIIYNGTTSSWFNELSRKRFNAVFTQIVPVVTIVNAPTWTTIPWNTEIIKDVDFTHVANSDEIIFNTSDVFLIQYNIVFTTGGNSKTYQARVEIDTGGGWAELEYTNTFGSSSGDEGNTVGTSFYHSFNAGDKIRVLGQSISNSTSFTIKVNSCSISIINA